MIAAASSSGVALGRSPLLDTVSGKIERTNKLHSGQIARPAEPRLPNSIPATKVPCLQAALRDSTQTPPPPPGSSRMFCLSKSGWLLTTGPSIKPIVISGRPAVRAINGRSLISSKSVIGVHLFGLESKQSAEGLYWGYDRYWLPISFSWSSVVTVGFR